MGHKKSKNVLTRRNERMVPKKKKEFTLCPFEAKMAKNKRKLRAFWWQDADRDVISRLFLFAHHKGQLMPIPSASSKIFWPCSQFFDLIQYFLNLVKYFWAWSNVIFYLIILHIWAWLKLFDHIQKYRTRSKFFEHIQEWIWTSRWIRHKHRYDAVLEFPALLLSSLFMTSPEILKYIMILV